MDILEYDLCELPRPDLVLFLHMPLEAAAELRKGREFSDGNEADLEYQRHSENTYLYFSLLIFIRAKCRSTQVVKGTVC